MCRQTLSGSCCVDRNDEQSKQKPETEAKTQTETENEKFFVSVLIEKDFSGSDTIELDSCLTATQIVEELKALSAISGPMVLTGLLQYSRAMISMLFLGRLGETELAGGSLAIGFANITGYSVISGLALGMEPICGQAYGAKRWGLLGLALQRMVLILLTAVVPTLILWLNMERILLFCRQDEAVTRMAAKYILFSVPDLFAQALLHPLRIYLRTQNVTFPLACTAAIAVALHVPINFLLVEFLGMGIAGVALAAAWTNLNLILSLLLYFCFSGVYKKTWGGGVSAECLSGWTPLLKLAIPSCVSVCLEWWWYELMIILCGLLINPKATVASMGILIQTTSLLYIFPSSLSVGVSTRVSNELGANRPDRARNATIVALTCASLLGFVAMSFANSVRHSWARLFTNDPEILKLTSMALPILGLCELGNCPQTTGCGVLRGSARPSLGANINLGSFYLIGMPIAVGTGFFFNIGFVGFWIGLFAAQASCLALMLYHLFRTDWTLQATRAIELTESQDPKISNDSEPLVAAT
ncbi:hypothetical protein SUGI_0887210 [Cryptomeria japonica]|uniref:protein DETOXIFICATION 49 n=1 Tax=Cryptomeria japonica TaxID=3369 RepID=UPI00241499CE|nr:protein DETOXIFICATION 49 [Cryptomeria japonica]GLJ42787.1 hypothetical protein SUGI_0887210 [Cryptomeria japonica]